MRLNKFIAQATGMSRRAADSVIAEQRVHVNGTLPTTGHDVSDTDTVELDGKPLSAPLHTRTVIFNKPPGYVVSRNGQGSKTIYDLLPPALDYLKPVGRLDKYSSGLLLLTNDGELANELTHPSHEKIKIYEVTITKPLSPLHRQMINDIGITLEDGVSKLTLERLRENDDTQWRISMHEGRNRQIRRTFDALGYNITRLHRVQFGTYQLQNLPRGSFKDIPT